MIRVFLVGCLLFAAASGCSRSHAVRGTPPSAEFLVTGADSTYWVSSGRETHVRGAPLTLARYDGKFFELYVADDDMSYNDALLLGERLYRRDIRSGDSTVVFADTAVRRVANAYAAAHPDEEPLGPNDDGEADPSTSATAEVDIMEVFGPYASYEYHVDVSLPRARPFHSTRRGVIDLRSGRLATVADVLGATTAARIERMGRQSFGEMRDSIAAERAALRGDDRRAADALLLLQFDSRSFTLTAVDDTLAVEFAVPGTGEGAAGNAVELDPIKVTSELDWWPALRVTLPVADEQGADRWMAPRYAVIARYDTSGENARVSLTDSTHREWPLGPMSGPLRRIEWLDRPPLGDVDRRALVRAFDAAASYDESARVASFDHTPIRPHVHTPTHASYKVRSRKPARNVRAHDARACQQHGARVRRCHSVDDGQVRGDLRVSAQPRGGGHGVDRPRRLSRARSSGRSRAHEGERELRRAHVDGSRRAR
jgi:hypothetical protein